jgi:ribosomal protein L11 methyltransferase
LATYSALTTLSGAAAAEALGEALERLDPAPGGVGVFEIEDGSRRWEVGGYFDAPPDIAGLALLAVLHGAADFTVSRVEDRDWVAQVRRELHPVHAGRFTVHGAHDSHRVGPERIGLKIEAAMAFGTGHHATTRGCLLLIDGLARQGLRRRLPRGARPRRVADIGCGTGVLAMAAARVWRARCVATDIDSVAAATACENVRANGLVPWITTGRAPGFRYAALRAAAPYDLVCANILAGPLKRLAPEIARNLAPGGHVVLSGILRGQAAGVEAVFRGHGLTRARRVILGDWVSLLLRRR